MGKTYKRKVVDHQWSLNKAARHYSIPYGTLCNKYVFTLNEEKSIIQAAVICGDWGFPLNVENLQMVTKSFLDSHGRVVNKFTNNMSGRIGFSLY